MTLRTLRTITRDIDRLLRGELTSTDELREGNVDVPARALLWGGLVLGAIYGLFMGLYSASRGVGYGVLPIVATMIKVPLFFLLTLLVTLPSLYVFSTLLGSRLGLRKTLRLLIAAVCVNLAVLASFGPVVGFFTLSTRHYHFMALLNVFFFAVGGMIGLGFLRRAVGAAFSGPRSEDGSSRPARGGGDTAAHRTFSVWILIYGVVGAQMGWILRPFVGNPHIDYTLFGPIDSNFFEFIGFSLKALF